jgi:hypothetical protein
VALAVRVDWAGRRVNAEPMVAVAVAVAASASPSAAPAGEFYVAAEAPGGAVRLDAADTGRVVPVLLPGIPAGFHRRVEVRTGCARASAKAEGPRQWSPEALR